MRISDASRCATRGGKFIAVGRDGSRRDRSAVTFKTEADALRYRELLIAEINEAA